MESKLPKLKPSALPKNTGTATKFFRSTRRSKSVADLRPFAEQKNISKNPLKRPGEKRLDDVEALPSKILKRTENNLNIIENPKTAPKTISAFTSGHLRRRSKSFTVLTGTRLPQTGKVLPKVTKPPAVRPPVTKPAIKKTDKSADAVKQRKAKIPDWDYKGRFNQLLEKHTSLQESYKNVRSELAGYDGLKEKYEDRLATLEKDQNELSEKYTALLINYQTLKKESEESLKDKQILFETLERKNEEIDSLVKENDELKQDIYKSEITRRKQHNTIQDLKGNIRVFCRVRPPINAEEEERLPCLFNFIDETSMEIRKSRESVTISGKPTDLKAEFSFDRVFPPGSSQEEVFEDLSQLIQSALDGYDVCVFAYGQTGSGKTYTMQGSEMPERLGMIPRTVDLIFDSIHNLQRVGWSYQVQASFLEIYNENIRDLLNRNSSHTLDICYNEGKGITVRNLRIEPINSANELKTLMLEAHKNRAVAATDFNEHSSRSHAVTKIYLHGINEEANITYSGSINLVDLAGSESAKTSFNERLTETKSINKSLSTLGNVMLALHNKDKHVPYRNSKLTYLLQSCLGGNSKTLMVVNIAPFEECYAESINSLRFAAKVKEVKTCMKRNKGMLNIPMLVGK